MEQLDYEKLQNLGKELTEAAMPLLAYLNKYYDPMCYAVVTEGRVEVFRAERSAPLPIRV